MIKKFDTNTKDKNPHLSKRQETVLKELSQGYSNKQIAHNLGIAEATIKMHVSSLLRTFDAQNRVQIVIKAKDNKLI